MATYTYQPLPPVSLEGRTPSYTRILHLFPSTSTNNSNTDADIEPFHGSLEITNIENTAPYEALSYTWGTDDPQTYIWLLSHDGVPLPLPIKPNLAAALRFLRPPAGDSPRRLWIDALCIDQSSHEERSRQVQYMRLVYKHASRVIAWLGSKSDTENADLAFETARRLAEVGRLVADMQSASASTPGAAGGSGSGSRAQALAAELRRVAADIQSASALASGAVGGSGNASGLPGNGFLAEATRNALSGLPDEAMRCLALLSWREYFQRTWVVQEIAVSKMAIAKCEELEMPFFDLISTLMFVFERSHGLPIEVPPTAQSLEGWYIIFARHLGPKNRLTDTAGSLGPLIELLEIMRDFKATDLRDKIYSLLGICDEGVQPIRAKTRVGGRILTHAATAVQDFANSHGLSLDLDRFWGIPEALRPDYSRSVPQVYTDLTKFMISVPPMELDVLGYVQHRAPPEPGDPYPSWVPKWFEPRTTGAFRGMGFSAGVYRPSLSGILQPTARVQRAFSVPGALTLEGFHVGTVHRVSDPMTPIIGDWRVATAAVLKAWRQLLPHLPIARPRPVQHSYAFTEEPLDVAFCKALAVHPMGTVYGHTMGDSFSLFQFRLPDLLSRWQLDTHQFAARQSDAAVESFIDFLSGDAIIDGLGLSGDGSATTGPERGGATFLNTVCLFCPNRRAFLTREGHFGIGPMLVQEGDEVVVLFRGKMPFVLRKGGESHHVLIGECYVRDDNIMYGRVAENVRHGKGGPPAVYFEIR